MSRSLCRWCDATYTHMLLTGKKFNSCCFLVQRLVLHSARVKQMLRLLIDLGGRSLSVAQTSGVQQHLFRTTLDPWLFSPQFRTSTSWSRANSRKRSWQFGSCNRSAFHQQSAAPARLWCWPLRPCGVQAVTGWDSWPRRPCLTWSTRTTRWLCWLFHTFTYLPRFSVTSTSSWCAMSWQSWATCIKRPWIFQFLGR